HKAGRAPFPDLRYAFARQDNPSPPAFLAIGRWSICVFWTGDAGSFAKLLNKILNGARKADLLIKRLFQKCQLVRPPCYCLVEQFIASRPICTHRDEIAVFCIAAP